MAIIDKEALKDRAGELKAKSLNGMKLILIKDLKASIIPSQAILEVYFYNTNEIANFKTTNPSTAQTLFTISGGHRILGGTDNGQVRVVKIQENSANSTGLFLTIEPIGDYSTYTLHLNHPKIDPLLNKIDFKFRPGCFNIDCAPAWEKHPPRKIDPVIDYLAKDYDSFKHTLINAMIKRVPGWQATSEADLDQVLIDLFSAAGDELSDFQDRVMNEAYLTTARKRISLVRHARLMDYHIHQGNQASTWLALELADGGYFDLPKGFLVWAGTSVMDKSSIVFISLKKQYLHHLLNKISLYTWNDSVPALKAGSVTADLKISNGNESQTKQIESLIHNQKVAHLLIQESLNPATGRAGGTNLDKRQVLKLLSGKDGAKAIQDPVTKFWYLRVWWEKIDKLKHNYCFVVDCSDGKKENISFFNGNLVQVYHGLPQIVVFKDSEETLGKNEYHYERTEKDKWGVICILPNGPLAYKKTTSVGDNPPRSTLEVKVIVGSSSDPWDEVDSLVYSGITGERGDHFVVETDEEGKSFIRFGNGINGKKLPNKAVVQCSYQIGKGPDGNIGADTLRNYDKGSFQKIVKVWNPIDAIDGRAPEPVEEIIRRVPDAYRARQLRAVTLNDYEDRAEELKEVSRASARYAWTGSWRTVRVSIDPADTTTLTSKIKQKIARHLESVRLIGEDIEIRPPRWVPLKIVVSLCVYPHYWPEDIKFVLDQEFSEGYLSDGRKAFFHPDNWTFGQSIHKSQIIGRAQIIQGVHHVKKITMKRWNESGTISEEVIKVKSNEIIQVRNNPDHMEEGSITFFVEGGRE